jgi:methylmalonyl-CoA/ethylmalonyl-CoA epimerase
MNADWKFMHAGLVVKDLAAARRACALLGASPGQDLVPPPPGATQKVLVQFVKLGDFELEFFQPVEGANMISAFLEKHGEGLHHLAFGVKDLDSETAILKQSGLEPILKINGDSGRRICFFDPGNLGGMVIELEQVA